jgi:glycosyltransferase involved in cell wall biosynthesis
MSIKEEIVKSISKQPINLYHEIAFDIVFILHVSGRGWILEKICRQIAEQSGESYTFVYSERNDSITAPIPRASKYFFAHYAIYVHALARHPELHAGSLFVWFTHPDFSKGVGIEDLVYALQQADLVFTANAQHASALEVMGLPKSALRTIYGGADPQQFRHKERGQGKVAFVGAYYERKQPDKMLEVISSMTDTEFMLLGPSNQSVENKGLLWSNYERYSELVNLPNLEIVETTYDEYAKYFGNIDVYVSLSRLEGGPIPLIEALMANAIPVVTRTGFCEEIIQHEENGLLLNIECSSDEISESIRQAVKMENNVSAGTEGLSWASFGASISSEMKFPLGKSFSVDFGRENKGSRYLLEGWDVPERLGAWQFSCRARLLLPLRLGYSLSSLKFKFRTGKIFGDVHKIEINFYLNGHLFGKEKLRQDRQCEIFFSELPPDISIRNNYLLIEVTSPVQGDNVNTRQFIRLEEIKGTAQFDASGHSSLAQVTQQPKRRRQSANQQIPGVLSIASEAELDEVVPTSFLFTSGAIDPGVPYVGWHEPEPGGLWSSQTEAYVVLPLSPELQKMIAIEVVARVFKPDLTKNNKIWISLSDGEVDQISEHEILGSEEQKFGLIYRNSSGRRVVRIRFSIQNIQSPFDIGIDEEDRRRLGIFLNRIELFTPEDH